MLQEEGYTHCTEAGAAKLRHRSRACGDNWANNLNNRAGARGDLLGEGVGASRLVEGLVDSVDVVDKPKDARGHG